MAKSNLEKAKEIFLAPDIDGDDLVDNQKQLQEWQNVFSQKESLLSWQGHEHTIRIYRAFKNEYKRLGVILAVKRDLTEDQRKDIYRKQDACLLMLELMSAGEDPKSDIQILNKQIEMMINVT